MTSLVSRAAPLAALRCAGRAGAGAGAGGKAETRGPSSRTAAAEREVFRPLRPQRLRANVVPQGGGAGREPRQVRWEGRARRGMSANAAFEQRLSDSFDHGASPGSKGSSPQPDHSDRMAQDRGCSSEEDAPWQLLLAFRTLRHRAGSAIPACPFFDGNVFLRHEKSKLRRNLFASRRRIPPSACDERGGLFDGIIRSFDKC